MARAFTGWHMTAIITGFFGVVIAVNMTMATLASRSFGGTVVDNSYVASQEFNGWLRQARAQRALGWAAVITVDGDRHVRVGGRLPPGAAVTAIASHPLGRIPDQPLRFTASGGSYRAVAPLPPGRFVIRVKVAAGGHVADFRGDLPA